jgi:alkylation response protein AidB-like acyl-CoA dehydrogenase
MGFTNEVLVSQLYRDLRLWSIGGGADEVIKLPFSNFFTS